MENAGSILASIFKNIGMQDGLTLVRLQREWANLFDEPLSLHIYPASLNNGILVVNVDSPLWLQQLKFFKQAILKKLEAYKINTLEFRHGSANLSRRSFVGKHSGTSTGEQTGHAQKALTETDVTWIDQTIATVNDPELQDSIRSVLEKALARKL